MIPPNPFSNPRIVPDDAESGLPKSPANAMAEGSVSVLGLMNVVLRHRLTVLASIGACVLATAVVMLTRPRTYTSEAVFMPQVRKAASPLSGLAAQFGLVGLGGLGAEPGQSPAFYVDLLTSRRILEQMATTSYEFTENGRRYRGTLISLYDLGAEHPARALDLTVHRVRSNIAVERRNREAGTIKVAVSSEHPALSKLMADRLLSLIDEFNSEQRRSQATAERRFVERRVAEVKEDLQDAENRLQRFLLRNRVAESPELTFDRERLTREVALRNQVYTTLVQAFEQARIEEVRDTPVLTVVEPPAEPARPDSRLLVVRLLVALIVGASLGVLLALIRDRWYSTAVPSPDYAEFRELWGRARNDVTHPITAIRRLRHRG
jgi:uncharacterized protein involved in exopolysaccharide biosynthesis